MTRNGRPERTGRDGPPGGDGRTDRGPAAGGVRSGGRGTAGDGQRIRDRRRGERHVWWGGLVLSVLVHVLVVLLWPAGSVPVAPTAAAGPRSGSPDASSGGMQALNLQARTTEIATPPPPTPVPTLDAVEPVQLEDEASVDAAALLGDRPGLEEPGAEIGDGQGDGGSDEEGLRSVVPPSPRGMIVPPTNDDLRGREISVWVFVDETGRVVPDSTRLEPPTRDDDFNERLVDEAAEWIFEPAREGGEPVAAWFPYTIRM